GSHIIGLRSDDLTCTEEDADRESCAAELRARMRTVGDSTDECAAGAGAGDCLGGVHVDQESAIALRSGAVGLRDHQRGCAGCAAAGACSGKYSEVLVSLQIEGMRALVGRVANAAGGVDELRAEQAIAYAVAIDLLGHQAMLSLGVVNAFHGERAVSHLEVRRAFDLVRKAVGATGQ